MESSEKRKQMQKSCLSPPYAPRFFQQRLRFDPVINASAFYQHAGADRKPRGRPNKPKEIAARAHNDNAAGSGTRA